MSPGATRMVCSACGAEIYAADELPFRCPMARPGDDVDHVLRKVLNPKGVRFSQPNSEHPFDRYRELLHSYQHAREYGLGDAEWSSLVASLDERIAAVDGNGFRRTRFARDEALSAELGFSEQGGVWVKNETRNVSGSHKSRHLFGVALYLAAFEQLGFLAGGGEHLFAIASCGNAALAAAVIARALENPLEVFIPVQADPAVVARLGALGARITTCPRVEGEAGDPCIARYRERIAAGALPFTVQGPENGLVVEGGSTLAYEIAEVAAERELKLDRVFVQVGGGALATACLQGFQEAQALGLGDAPIVQTVQTLASPLAAAYARVAEHPTANSTEFSAHVAQHRSEFMQPLASEPHSIASGILDDETYDWRALVEHAVATQSPPITCAEERLKEAWELGNRGRKTKVCATGTAGLAGLLEVRARGELNPDDNVAVLFTGAQR